VDLAFRGKKPSLRKKRRKRAPLKPPLLLFAEKQKGYVWGKAPHTHL
jgi:hypothetical protein